MRKPYRFDVAAGALICKDALGMSDLVSDVLYDGVIPAIWSCKERGDVRRCFCFNDWACSRDVESSTHVM